jgi:hypothetical protein
MYMVYFISPFVSRTLCVKLVIYGHTPEVPNNYQDIISCSSREPELVQHLPPLAKRNLLAISSACPSGSRDRAVSRCAVHLGCM